jgi:hypothetical protein
MKLTENCQVPVVHSNLNGLVRELQELVSTSRLTERSETAVITSASDRAPERKPAAGTGNLAKS